MAVRKKLKPLTNKVLKSYVETGNMSAYTGIVTSVIGDPHKANVIAGMLKGGNVRSLLREELLKRGYDLGAIAQDLIDLRNARKTIYATKDGVITDTMELQDNGIKLGTVSLITKLVGMQDNNTDNGVPDNNKIHDMDSDELRRLVEMGNTVEAEYEEVQV